MKKVAIVGSQGVPAKYGGFETFVENVIGENCPPDIKYTVFCSGKDYTTRQKVYKGANLEYIPFFHANGMQSILYDILSLCKCVKGFDTILVLGTSGCISLPVFRLFYRKKLIINIDGLEHRREKWGKFARWFLKLSESMAVRYADEIVADNKGIQDYVTEVYKKPSNMIAYGGDHIKRKVSEERKHEILEKYGVTAGHYAISASRIEPENNSHLICEAFAKNGKSLIFVGNWGRNDYSRGLREKYKSCKNIRMVDSLYDLDELFALRGNCSHYIHGHSAGGTNPSLVEAMSFGMPILAFDVIYNRETMHNKGYYFRDVNSLIELLEKDNLQGEPLREIAEDVYHWKYISQQYVALF